MSDLLRAGRLPRLAVVPVALWLGFFLVLPVATMVARFVGWEDVVRVVSRESTWRVVWFSVWQAVLSVAATFAVAAPVTWLIGRHEFAGRRALRAVATIGFLLPSVVVAAGFLAVLPKRLHYTVPAVLLAHAYFNVAVVVRVVGARLEMHDRRLTDAARLLGATPTSAFRTVTWPLIRQAVSSAAIVVFLYCFTSFAVIRVLGGPGRNTMESDVALRAFGVGDVGGATVLAMMQVLVVLVVLALLGRGVGSGISPIAAGATALSPVPRRHRAVAATIAVATTSFVVAPLLSVVRRSFDVGGTTTLAAWRSVFDGAPTGAVIASLRTAVVAAMAGVVLAAAAGLAISRSGGAGRILDAATVVPLATSPVTLGLGLVVTFDQAWYDWRGEWWFVAVAHTVVAFPLAVRVLVPAWRAVPAGQHDAAAVLGAGELRRLFDVDLRFVGRAIVAALGLVVAVSLGEFGSASILSRAGTETIPVAIGRLLGRTGDLFRAQAFALSTLLIMVCAGALLLVELAGGRGSDAEGR